MIKAWCCLMFFVGCICVTLAAQEVPVKSRVTVVKHYKIGKSESGQADTLLNRFEFDAGKQAIDVYFCFQHLQLPYILPTDGFQVSPAQRGECNMTKDREKAKCYKYDKNGRVTEMHVGALENNNWEYHFNKKGQLIRINQHEDTYDFNYLPNGNLSRISLESSQVTKLLEFSYE